MKRRGSSTSLPKPFEGTGTSFERKRSGRRGCLDWDYRVYRKRRLHRGERLPLLAARLLKSERPCHCPLFSNFPELLTRRTRIPHPKFHLQRQSHLPYRWTASATSLQGPPPRFVGMQRSPLGTWWQQLERMPSGKQCGLGLSTQRQPSRRSPSTDINGRALVVPPS